MFRRTRTAAAIAALALTLPASSSQADEGCWVQVFAAPYFREPLTTYIGPRHEPAFAEARSLIVGPNARLVGYDGARYQEETLALGPGTRVTDLSRIGFDRRVDSFQVVCTGGLS